MVVMYTYAAVLHVQLQAVVGINEYTVYGLLLQDLLKEYDDVRIAVHLLVADHCKVLINPLVRLLTLIVCHGINRSVNSKLHESHLQRSCSVF